MLKEDRLSGIVNSMNESNNKPAHRIRTKVSINTRKRISVRIQYKINNMNFLEYCSKDMKL